MIIRNEQFETFRENITSRFVHEIIKKLKDDHKEAIYGLSDAVLGRRVEGGVEKGQIYGLTRKSDLMMFVILMFEIAPCFSEYPSINDILIHNDIEPDEKINLLLYYIKDYEWAQAKAIYVESDWELLSKTSEN